MFIYSVSMHKHVRGRLALRIGPTIGQRQHSCPPPLSPLTDAPLGTMARAPDADQSATEQAKLRDKLRRILANSQSNMGRDTLGRKEASSLITIYVYV